MSGDWTGAKTGGVPFVDHGLGCQTLDPREWSGVGEAEIVGEEEDEVLVIGRRGEKGGSWFGLVTQVIVLGGLKIAKKKFAWHIFNMT